MSFSDLAITKSIDDELERVAFCKSVADVLVAKGAKTASGVVLGISGPWGSGKSSILNMVQEQLEEGKPAPLVINFQPWITSGLNDLIFSFLYELKRELQGQVGRTGFDKKEIKRVANSISRYALAIGKHSGAMYTVFDPIGGGIFSVVIGFLSWLWSLVTCSKPKTIVQMRDELKNEIDNLSNPVVIVIDEVDRLTNSEIVAMAQLVKAVAYFENVSFLLAYDAERMAQAFDAADVGKKGRSYLEKIVQYELSIPFLHPDKIKEIVIKRFSESAIAELLPRQWERDEDFNNLMDLLIPLLIRSPRDVGRLVNAVVVTQKMVGDDVYWVDAIGFHALDQKVPEVSDKIRSAPWKVMQNPGFVPRADFDVEIERSVNKENASGPTWREDIIGSGGENAGLRKLLEFLFPALKKENDLNWRAEHPDSLRNERSLTSMLQLGLPTGEISLEYIKANVGNEHKSQIDFLIKVEEDGKLEPFIRRFSRVQDRFNRNQVKCVWRAVATYCDRPINELKTDPEYKRIHLTDRLFRDWLHALENDDDIASDIAGFAGQLMSDGSIEFLSCLLHYFSHQHGLFGYEKRNVVDGVALSRSNTEGYSLQWSERVADFLIDREKIQGLRTPQPIYLAVSAGGWKEKHRLFMSDMLTKEDVIDPIILSFFGTSNMTDRVFVEKFLDMDKLRTAFDVRLHNMMGGEQIAGLRDVYKRASHFLGFDTK